MPYSLYDYDYAGDDYEGDKLYEIFRVSDGRPVARADSKSEAEAIIDELEREDS